MNYFLIGIKSLKLFLLMVRFMVFNATFNNISIITFFNLIVAYIFNFFFAYIHLMK